MRPATANAGTSEKQGFPDRLSGIPHSFIMHHGLMVVPLPAPLIVKRSILASDEYLIARATSDGRKASVAKVTHFAPICRKCSTER